MKVTEIVVTRKDGTEISLQIDEARDLYKQLDRLFGTPEERRVPAVPYPIIIEKRGPFWPNQTWCKNSVSMKTDGSVDVVLKGD